MQTRFMTVNILTLRITARTAIQNYTITSLKNMTKRNDMSKDIPHTFHYWVKHVDGYHFCSKCGKRKS